MTDAALESVRELAHSLTGEDVASVEQAAGGGNSRIYKVISGGKTYALKRYPTIEGDTRDRLGTERLALTLFEKEGLGCTPRWFASNPPYALMEWVEGNLVTAPLNKDIEESVAFLTHILQMSERISFESMPPASEACLSAVEIMRQIRARYKRLLSIEGESELQDFLNGPMLAGMAEREDIARQSLPNFDKPLPTSEQRLIPADFGFHNALKTPDNKLVFIDFEYFGWDDPVKLISDFLLHPAMNLSEDHQMRFHKPMMAALPASASSRFHVLYPLFGLRWTLILLNEFLPERWQARKEARGEQDAEAARKRQLEKARAMLAKSAAYEG